MFKRYIINSKISIVNKVFKNIKSIVENIILEEKKDLLNKAFSRFTDFYFSVEDILTYEILYEKDIKNKCIFLSYFFENMKF